MTVTLLPPSVVVWVASWNSTVVAVNVGLPVMVISWEPAGLPLTYTQVARVSWVSSSSWACTVIALVLAFP